MPRQSSLLSSRGLTAEPTRFTIGAMTQPTQVLLYRPSYERIQPLLEAQAIEIEPILMQGDGTLNAQGAHPQAAWFGIDTMIGGPARDYMVAVLKSASMKWVQTASAGLDNPIWAEILGKGIRLTNSDAQAIAIAEFVMAGVIAHFQPTFERRDAQQAHQWKRLGFREICTTKWLIIGFGHIGSEIGRRARGFEAHVTGVRRSAQPHVHADQIITQSEITEALPQADVVVLACPLNEATRLMVSEDFFVQMKEGSTLVNIGRGDLIDEEAMVKALNKGIPEVAILDVFQTEPLPQDSPLWDHPSIRVSGHTSAFGSGTRARGDQLFVDNLKRFIAGDPLRNEVDPNQI